MKPFIIIMGDAGDDFKKVLIQNSATQILDGSNAQGWILLATDHAIYWLLSDVVSNLTHQFMHYKNPMIYILVNFTSQNHLEALEQNYKMLRRDLILGKKEKNKLPQKIMVVGLNFKANFNTKMKKQVLEWCIKTESEIKCEYIDFDKFIKKQL